MKKLLCFSLFILPAFCCYGQAGNLGDIKTMMQGTWLSKGDSTIELSITPDSIVTFRFKLNGVSACTYALAKEACEKIVKFPSATGIYMTEHYKNKDVCCALSMLSPTLIKIIYPDGTEMSYVNEKMLQKVK